MESLQSLLPILVSIVLFVLTLILIFLLRLIDRKDRRLDLVKRFIGQRQTEMQQTFDRFRLMAEAAQDSFIERQAGLEHLIERLELLQNEIEGHAENFDQIQNTLGEYHQVITGLSQLTEQVEARITQIKEDEVSIKRLQGEIEPLLNQIEASVDLVELQKREFEQLLDNQKARLALAIQESLQEAQTGIEEISATALTQADNSFQTMIGTVRDFLGELQNQMYLYDESAERLNKAAQETLDSLIVHLELQKRLLAESASQKPVPANGPPIEPDIDPLPVVETEEEIEASEEEFDPSTEEGEVLSETVFSPESGETVQENVGFSEPEEDSWPEFPEISGKMEETDNLKEIESEELSEYPAFFDEDDFTDQEGPLSREELEQFIAEEEFDPYVDEDDYHELEEWDEDEQGTPEDDDEDEEREQLTFEDDFSEQKKSLPKIVPVSEIGDLEEDEEEFQLDDEEDWEE